jgi:hypothetical protein
MTRVFIALVLLSITFGSVACGDKSASTADPAAPEGTQAAGEATPEQQAAEQAAQAALPAEGQRYSGPITFADVSQATGVRFRHTSGAFGKKYLPETMGPGCAFLDFDDDGWQDILLVNSTSWPERKSGSSFSALYRNNQNGTFSDVTRQAGLAVDMYGLGCAVGDYDNDGRVDIYITAVGQNRLFHNEGGGRFSDVTARAGVGDTGFSASAAWFDADRDGNLDLYVTNYVEWSPEKDIYFSLDGKNKSYSTPQPYKGQSPAFFKNRGNGTFENATQRAGLYDPTCKALGVALIDFNDDGLTDLFVSNDTEPNRLYRNNGNVSFTDVAVEAGVAFGESGAPRAGMGTDAADYDNSGRPGIVVGNFTTEMIALYRNEGSGLFVDEAGSSAVGSASANSLTFACFFFDYDLDGLLDIFAANGHVSDDISVVQPKLRYAQPPLLFRNFGKGFEVANLGPALQQSIVGRGAAYGDIDNDGDLDLLVTSNNGMARLLRNEGGNQNNLLRVRTVGSVSNRDAIGARVTVVLPDNRRLTRTVKTGSSYCSQSEMPLTFGLEKYEGVVTVEVKWPSGRADVVPNVPVNHAVTIQEGVGVSATSPVRLVVPTS